MAAQAGRPRRPRRRVLRAIVLFGSLFLGVHLLLPLASGLGATAEAVARASWWLPWVLLVLEAGSFLAYGELELVVLRAAGAHPSRVLIQRTTVVGSSLGKTLPGGAATATAVTISTLRAQGVDAAIATSGLLATSAISWVALALLLPLGAALAVGAGELGAVTLGTAGLALGVVVIAALAPLMLRQPDRTAAFVERAAVLLARGPLRRRLDRIRLGSIVFTGITSAARFIRDRNALLESCAWACANWLLDASVLVVLAATIGGPTPLLPLLLVYIVGQLVALIPLTPGGVGPVEAGMVALLVGAGAPAGAATAVVLGWRLVSHWLPIVVGLALLPTVARGRPIAR